jgi:hypothetical protein
LEIFLFHFDEGVPFDFDLLYEFGGFLVELFYGVHGLLLCHFGVPVVIDVGPVDVVFGPHEFGGGLGEGEFAVFGAFFILEEGRGVGGGGCLHANIIL